MVSLGCIGVSGWWHEPRSEQPSGEFKPPAAGMHDRYVVASYGSLLERVGGATGLSGV